MDLPKYPSQQGAITPTSRGADLSQIPQYARTDVHVALPIFGGARDGYPVYDGVFRYFPSALAQVARASAAGSRQHQVSTGHRSGLGWRRDVSTAHADKIVRHLIDHDIDPTDSDGVLHLAKVAWRALALLQEYCEQNGHPVAPASIWPTTPQQAP